jgi:hypothetical protein
MDPQTQFCHNPECSARGRVGQGNSGGVSVARRVVGGTAEAIAEVLARTGGGTGINTVYTKRLNATFRSALAALVPGSGHCPYGEGADGGDVSGRVRLQLLLGSQESPAGRGCGRKPHL